MHLARVKRHKSLLLLAIFHLPAQPDVFHFPQWSGRLEVQIEIPLPERSQRREILQIHFAVLRRENRLSYPLRCAIDGKVPEDATSSDLSLFKGRNRWALNKAAPTWDLADKTEGFSGADIEGLVRCAGSIALSRARKDGRGVESLLITLDDVEEALKEVAL